MHKPTDIEVTVYTPDSQMRTPGKLIISMGRDLYNSWELSWQLFVRDLSALYRQSMLGVIWAFIPPIITSAIFIFLQSRNIVNFGETPVPYPVYVLVSVILWQIFAESFSSPLKSVTASKPFLVKIYFPREALIVSSFLLVLFNSLVKLVILGVILVIFRVPLTGGLLLFPLPFFMLIILGMGLGLLITPLGMLYTDVSTAIPLILQLWFFITPVVYPPPETFPLYLIVILNPVSPLLIAARDLITLGAITNMPSFLVTSGLSILCLIFAWILYRIAMPIIIERISA